jgi:BirA family biotin operon repressor/biotin-[acetyl-CoA-carboxylase] ligase
MPELPYKIDNHDNTHIHYYSAVSSTMDIARNMAQSNCPDNTVIIAKYQHSGRGRMQRQWNSDDGGLYMTWVIRPRLNPMYCFAYTFSAALAIIHSLDQLFNITAQVKWPNDILIHTQKIAGILTETQFENNQFTYLNIGIGINVNNQLKTNAFNAISVQDLVQTHVDMDNIIPPLCQNLTNQFANICVEHVLESWKAHNCTLGKKVRILMMDRIVDGRAVDISQDGALIIAQSNGQLETVTYGDCIVPGFQISSHEQ